MKYEIQDSFQDKYHSIERKKFNNSNLDKIKIYDSI